jgi:hypothetical protein
MNSLRRVSVLLLLASLAAISANSQTGETRPPPDAGRLDPELEKWKPAILPAAALSYGAALEEAAPPRLKDWLLDFARSEMPNRKMNPRETMAAVDKQFPKQSDVARDAAIFLLNYLSYKEEDLIQRTTAALIRRLDDEAYDIQFRMQQMRDSEMNRMVTTRSVPSQQEMVRNSEEAIRMEQRLKELAEQRRRRLKDLEKSRKRVDGFLKILDVTYPRMSDVPVTALRDFQ